VAVVINDFEVVPAGGESGSQAGKPAQPKGGSSAQEIEKQISAWIEKKKERSLRNWAH
jgi:hypothetical protein